jgi:hypothetical protein
MSQRFEAILQTCKRILSDVVVGSKNMLTRDYSVQDLRRLPQVIKEYWHRVLHSDDNGEASSQSSQESAVSTQLQLKKNWNANRFLLGVWQWVLAQRKWILIVLLLLGVTITFESLINPYAKYLHEKLDLRPAQWTQLQQLVLLNKSSSAPGVGPSAPSANGLATVSLLDETEMQKIQLVFTSRGIKPGVLRMNVDNPPHIELQVNEVMFSVLLDALEELRVNWHLYPTQMNMFAGSGAGMVSANGSLRQYSGQLGVGP